MTADAQLMGRRVTAVAQKIAAYAGDQSRAIQTFQTCIEAIENSAWPSVAWQFSGLTVDGSPVEFAFSSTDSALRYTVEVAGPEITEHARLDAACALMTRLGYTPPPPELVEEWRSLQRGFHLLWGAWLGVRYDTGGESLKIYIEVPDEAPPPSIETSALFPRVRGSRLLMIGYEPLRGRFEYYFRKKVMDALEFESVMHLIDPPNRRELVRATFAEVCGRPIETLLRWFAPVYSLAYRDRAAAPYLALFVRATSIGGASAARRHLVARESRSGRGASAYRDLIGSIANRDLPDHGVVTLGLGAGCELDLRVGISGVALATLNSPSPSDDRKLGDSTKRPASSAECSRA